ncbi:MAG: acyltransferase family protein [Actinoallomurus sp.]
MPAAQDERPARLGWLDALRGIAALVVAFHHSSFHFMPEFRRMMLNRFDAGAFGVMVFFLVSGYIIPASLERKGSIGGFWLSRAFRIYPLWCASVTAVILFSVTGLKPLRGDLTRQEPATAVLGHATMLQDLLAVPNMINVLWTLSYEMSFYLLVVALFGLRLHRHSSKVALGLAGCAVALGGLLPMTVLSRTAGTDLVVILVTALMAAAIGCSVTGRPVLRTCGAVAGGALALVLVTVNGRIGPWEGLSILAVMFTGTALYRAERGQLGHRTAGVTAAVVLAALLGSGLWHGDPDARLGWATAVTLAAVTFAVGLALRHRRIPWLLTALGVISYSIYLLHPVLLMVTDGTIGRWKTDNPVVELGFLAMLLPVCWATHRLVEAPAQRWGRRLGNQRPRLNRLDRLATVPAGRGEGP